MLSYQHAFHAGNHADILKHYVLSFVINSLNKKDKPYTVFDTHSGSGLYDLYDNRNLKTGEGEKGIKKLLESADKAPDQIKAYLNLITEYTDKALYPGSPEIERRLLRKTDTLILSELHPQEIENLKNNMTHPVIHSSDCVVPQVHNRNGWEMIKALTPPSTKRGAVLIDPSYEETQDYLDATKYICEINRKWSNGIIMLWYPLLLHREGEIETMINTIISSAKNVNANIEISNLQLCVYEKDSPDLPRLYGSGMLVINSPWKLEEEGTTVINFVKSVLAPQFQLGS